MNVGSLFEAGWSERRHEIVAWIDKLDADVICLQEVWQDIDEVNTARWIADASAADYHSCFGGHGVEWLAREKPNMRFGSAVLSKWPIDDQHTFRLPLAPDPEDFFVAGMPWELVHARTAGLDVFTTHLAAAPSHGRHRQVQVQAIEDHVRTIRGDRDEHIDPPNPRMHMPAILTGDFNAEPDSDEIRFLKGHTMLGGRSVYWQDAWATGGDGGQGLTQDWRTHELAASLNVHRKRIDYVFVGDPFLRSGHGGRVLSAKVVADEPLTGVQASDHCGLYVEIEWANRPD